MNTHLLTMILASTLALAGCGSKENAAAEPNEQSSERGQTPDGEHNRVQGDARQSAHIELTGEQVKAAGIELIEAGPARIRETLSLYGVVAPNAERVREVVARFHGVIRDVSAKIGDPVRSGDTLARVESNESLQTYAVVAPLAGVVTTRSANPGEQSGDKVLFTVADLSTVWVELSMFPRDVGKIRVGQQVRVTNVDAAMSADGKIVYVAPFGTSSNQTLTARVLLDNPERRWAPGLYVSAEVILSESQAAVAIRNEALQTLDGRSVVFARTEAGFEPRPVRLARADSEHAEVVEGLALGESYAGKNSFILKAELGKGEAEHDD